MIVWLASYPRSGNTFFRVILNSVFEIKTYSIYDDRGDIGADEKTSEVVGHEFLPENFDLQKARDNEKTYYIKTHELLDNRVDSNDKVIYLIRDGRESTLSFTKHQNTFYNHNKKFIDTIRGNTFIGGWGEHVRSWNPKYRENTLLVRFEDLIKEPIKYIETLAKFLEVNPIGDSIPTFDELKKINPKFFRSGKTNSWENIYNEEEHLSFWFHNNKVMDDYGYEYKKPDLFNDLKNNKFILESIDQNNYLINLILNQNKKTDSLNNKQKLIETKNKEIIQAKENITKRDRQISEQNQKIQEQNQKIQEQNQKIQNQNQKIQNQNQIIQEQNSDLKNYSLLMDNIKLLTTHSILRHPIAKAKQYKEILKLFDNIKYKNKI